MVMTERYKIALIIKHLKAAMDSILICANGAAETLPETKSKLAIIEIIAGEALFEAEQIPSET